MTNFRIFLVLLGLLIGLPVTVQAADGDECSSTYRSGKGIYESFCQVLCDSKDSADTTCAELELPRDMGQTKR